MLLDRLHIPHCWDFAISCWAQGPNGACLEADSEGLDAGCVRGDDLGMDRLNIEAVEPAVKALNDCDVEPFVGLMAKDMVWRGHQSRWLWWREAPS